MQSKFFSSKKIQPDNISPICSIQIPSHEDISQMHGMPAGIETEDQQLRIKHMVELLEGYPSLPLRTTDEFSISDDWRLLFAAINKGKTEEALSLFNQIHPSDVILGALLAVHSKSYIQQLIVYSINALTTGVTVLNSDIIITPKTFEILIKDIATTMHSPSKMCFSFGLPTHHAYSGLGSGFCLINKTAVLMQFWESLNRGALNYIIIGSDVNRDDGLSEILRKKAYLPVCHIDIFDSRVFPFHNAQYIAKEFGTFGKENAQKIRHWQEDNLEYFTVDLSLTTRKKIGLHPALHFALYKLKEQINIAKTNGQKIALLLPTGWDSHEDETAYCGKFVDGHMMSQSEARKTRFNDGDLTYFYEQLLQIYTNNKEHIAGFYWGLEGGYNRAMYERQIRLLIQVINEQLLNPEPNTSLRCQHVTK